MAMTPGGKNARAALALRLAGASYMEIADAVGYTDHVTARQAVVRELAGIDTDTASRERLRAEEGARIERLMRSVWGKATDQNHPEHLMAVRTALSLIDRHARLFGLDTPVEQPIYTPTTAEIDQWVAQLIEGSAGATVIEAEVIEIEPS